jgi:two-component sensor histidine kinase
MTGRIRSMALLHESLYRSGMFAQVELGQYLQTLGQQAFRANVTSGAAVQLELDLATVTVSLNLAGPAGLLVNELISNSLKHAFPEGRSGVLRLALQPASGSQWCLSVSDNGVGLTDDFDTRRTGALGMQLVSDLTQQIGGTLEVDAHGGEHGGAMFRIYFEVEE